MPDEKYWTPSSAPRYRLVNFVKKSLGTNAVAGVEVLNEIDLFYTRDNFVHDFSQAGLFWVAGSSDRTNKLVDDRNSSLWWGRYAEALTRDIYAAMKADPHLAAGLNVSGGKIRHKAVADALGLEFVPG